MKKFQGAILAGISISIGCIVFMKVGGVAGAVLFSFGLLTCVHFKLPLYTGTAGFVMNRKELAELAIILLGNIVGCLLLAFAMRHSLTELPNLAEVITAKRIGYTWWQSVLLGTMCGFMMTVAVKFGRENRFLPLLFAVPVFILCGFLHSIADAFYILVSPLAQLSENAQTVILNYASVVLGNLIGCNLYRIVYWTKNYSA